MAKTKKEKVTEPAVEKTVEETKQQEQPKEETPKVDLSKFESKDDDSVIKVDLSKPKKQVEDNVEEKVENKTEEKTIEEVVDEVKEEVNDETNEEQPIIEEVTEEEQKDIEEVKEEVVKAVEEAEATGKPLPENIEKLVKFMEETGGDLEDYVKLNQDTSKLDDSSVLREYYKQTKPHLTGEEIDFLMEDQFSYDEEEDAESKYYEEIKAGSKLTPEQQKAVDFFNRYNKESEENKKTYERQNSAFLKQTNQVFNNKFKGFEYNVGDKKYRFNVKNADSVKQSQSDINNFVKKFLNKDNVMQDAKGYHKSLFTAMNADAVAKHFYEQGKADAIKNSISKAKNVDMKPRQSFGNVESSGIKVRVLGNDSNDFKFKIKNKR